MSTHRHLPPPSLEELGLQHPGGSGARLSGAALIKPKKFRFQLLADFVAITFDAPLRVADVGGGKGLLSYLLCQYGYSACVIDPEFQELPGKYKNLKTGKRVRIPGEAHVPRISESFEVETAQDFDLLIGLHAHGSNSKMLEAAARYRKPCILMPCCVIGEPNAPAPGESWFQWLVMEVKEKGLEVEYFFLNFKGQNVGFVAR